jgi:hypothetical protein
MLSRKTRSPTRAHLCTGTFLEEFKPDEVRRLFVLRALVRHGRVHEWETDEPISGSVSGPGNGSSREWRSLHGSAALGRGVARRSTRRGYRFPWRTGPRPRQWVAEQLSVLAGLLLLLLVLGGVLLPLSLPALSPSWAPSLPPTIVGVSPRVVPAVAPSGPDSPPSNIAGPRGSVPRPDWKTKAPLTN